MLVSAPLDLRQTGADAGFDFLGEHHGLHFRDFAQEKIFHMRHFNYALATR